ncbi:hypothetical protein [Celeribacter sp.]|uniref:hypothetical protein n=1 Tax=Celeribacter sp. TaxID=1890673 RepID=UPI003A8CD8AA
MTPDQIPAAALGTMGVAVGVFLGALIGLSVAAKRGQTSFLYRNSVYATAFLASMMAWFIAIMLKGILG